MGDNEWELRRKLKPVQGQRPLDPWEIKVVLSKNFEVTQFVSHAQFVVGLKLVPVAGSADALKVFTAVWTASSQSADKPCRHDVIHVASDASLFEIQSTGFHFAFPSDCSGSMLLPSVPRRAVPWPLPVQVVPRYRSLLCAETCLAEGTPPYGKKDLATYAVDSSLPDAVGAFVDWLIRESGWTVTESGNPNDRVPIAARHICLLFRRFQNFGEDVMRPYVQALEARRILHMVVGGKSFHTREEVEALRTALTAIEWPDDELSAYATLRGSFFALTDESLFAYAKARPGA